MRIEVQVFYSGGFCHNPTHQDYRYVSQKENARNMWSVVSSRLAAPSKLWLMSWSPSRPHLLDQATGARIATVEELRALCEQAQCGVRNEKVTDLSVRKTLRAPPGKVAVEWTGLQAALAQLEREGFLRGPVTAELHDVLLYSPGDFFKPHVDTKKGPKHLMTLAVDAGLCPPCRGGQLLFGTYKEGREESLLGAGSFCAWYTNVVHEVTPLRSGNRCVAVYNVSAEAANIDQYEKSKLDSIVDALRLLLQEKANDRSENSTKSHVGFSLGFRYSGTVAESDESYVPRCNLFGPDEVLLKALEYGFGVPNEDLKILKAVKVDDYTADFFEDVSRNPRFQNVPIAYFGLADLNTPEQDRRAPVGGLFRTTWFMNDEPKFDKDEVGHVQGNDEGEPGVCVPLQLPSRSLEVLPRTERHPRARAKCERRRGQPTWQYGWSTGAEGQGEKVK
jgi:predicted 2-oxoglutarate/Fe(II)-dependent dioxygenase YbiX